MSRNFVATVLSAHTNPSWQPTDANVVCLDAPVVSVNSCKVAHCKDLTVETPITYRPDQRDRGPLGRLSRVLPWQSSEHLHHRRHGNSPRLPRLRARRRPRNARTRFASRHGTTWSPASKWPASTISTAGTTSPARRTPGARNWVFSGGATESPRDPGTWTTRTWIQSEPPAQPSDWVTSGGLTTGSIGKTHCSYRSAWGCQVANPLNSQGTARPETLTSPWVARHTHAARVWSSRYRWATMVPTTPTPQGRFPRTSPNRSAGALAMTPTASSSVWQAWAASRTSPGWPLAPPSTPSATLPRASILGRTCFRAGCSYSGPRISGDDRGQQHARGPGSRGPGERSLQLHVKQVQHHADLHEVRLRAAVCRRLQRLLRFPEGERKHHVSAWPIPALARRSRTSTWARFATIRILASTAALFALSVQGLFVSKRKVFNVGLRPDCQ